MVLTQRYPRVLAETLSLAAKSAGAKRPGLAPPGPDLGTGGGRVSKSLRRVALGVESKAVCYSNLPPRGLNFAETPDTPGEPFPAAM